MAESASGERGAQRQAHGLCVLFDLGAFVGAIPIEVVERVVPAHAVRKEPRGTRRSPTTRSPTTPSPTTRSPTMEGTVALPGRELSSFLPNGATTFMWLVLQPSPGRAFRAALGVGLGLGTRDVGQVHPLPPSVFSWRLCPYLGMFRLDQRAGEFEEGRLGLVLDGRAVLEGREWSDTPLDVVLAEAASERRSS